MNSITVSFGYKNKVFGFRNGAFGLRKYTVSVYFGFEVKGMYL